MLQENKWMPCITSRLETIYPFKIQLQQERITEIKCCQVKITKKAVSTYFGPFFSNYTKNLNKSDSYENVFF